MAFAATEHGSPMPVAVSLQQFILTGTFGPVVSGCSSDELEAVFGPPESIGGQSRRYKRGTIWKYGDVEFIFDQSSRTLRLIHFDRFSGLGGQPKGWGGLLLDPWCVRSDLSRATFLAALRNVGCEHQIREEPQFDRELVRVESGVEIGFCREDGEEDWKLFGLWRITTGV